MFNPFAHNTQEHDVTITLEKNEPITLAKANPGIKRVTVGLGWKPRTTAGAVFDLDASALAVKNDGTPMNLRDVAFYNILNHWSGAIQHMGDNRTGNGEGGDDEQIHIDLDKVPSNINQIVLIVSIDEAVTRRQTFGQVDGAYFRVVNEDTGAEVVKFDLQEDADKEHTVILGELFRETSTSPWQIVARTEGFKDGLAGALSKYHVELIA